MGYHAIARIEENSTLTHTARTLLLSLGLAMDDRSFSFGIAIPSLAERARCDPRTARRALQRAEAVGEISVEAGGYRRRDGQRVNLYTLLLPPCRRERQEAGAKLPPGEGTSRPLQKAKLPPLQQFKPKKRINHQTNPGRTPCPAAISDVDVFSGEEHPVDLALAVTGQPDNRIARSVYADKLRTLGEQIFRSVMHDLQGRCKESAIRNPGGLLTKLLKSEAEALIARQACRDLEQGSLGAN